MTPRIEMPKAVATPNARTVTSTSTLRPSSTPSWCEQGKRGVKRSFWAKTAGTLFGSPVAIYTEGADQRLLGGLLVTRPVCRPSLSWENAGAHDVPDDLHAPATNASVDMSRTVFGRVFDEMGHREHHEMMTKSVSGKGVPHASSS